MENEDLSSPAPAPGAAPDAAAAPAPATPVFDPRRRIRELLSIPERDRSDAEWDELNELEIQTAPGNRAGNPQQMPGQSAKPGFHSKNRMKGKGKPGGPGGGPGGGRSQGNPGNKPHNQNKPRPA